MATIYPVIVNSSGELDKAASENKAAILVVNKDLIPAIKKEVREHTKKEIKYRKSAKTADKGLTVGVLGKAVSGIAALAGAPIVAIPAALVSDAGIVVAGAGTFVTLLRGRSIQAAYAGLFSKLNYYAWSEVFEGKYLLLVKIDGRNKYNPQTDIISFDQIQSNS